MSRLPILRGALAFALTVLAGEAHAALGGWELVRGPTNALSASIGEPNSGCLAGGKVLPADGPGWQVVRLGRNRNWGHPRLVAFLHVLATKGRGVGLPPILVGDMSQPRGGPMPSGHRSHQTGLDVDLMFEPPPPNGLRMPEREAFVPRSVLEPSGAISPARFGRNQRTWLRLAAASPEVDRIFVNFRLKKALCAEGGNHDWLHRIRPWNGHDEHFHVRLTCTAGDSGCRAVGAPIPPGDGCGAELDSWLAHPAPVAPPKPPAAATPARRPVLPAACDAVIRIP